MTRRRARTHAVPTRQTDLPIQIHGEDAPVLPVARKDKSGRLLRRPQQAHPAATVADFRTGAHKWRATAVSADPHSIGFHLSALYSPLGWKSWAQIARDWLAAQGSEEMLRAARNTLLGETWVESGDAPEWQRLAERREAFGTQIPEGGLFLTAGVDVQKERIEVDVWAWGRDRTSWLVDHIVIAGGPDDPGSCPGAWCS